MQQYTQRQVHFIWEAWLKRHHCRKMHEFKKRVILCCQQAYLIWSCTGSAGAAHRDKQTGLDYKPGGSPAYQPAVFSSPPSFLLTDNEPNKVIWRQQAVRGPLQVHASLHEELPPPKIQRTGPNDVMWDEKGRREGRERGVRYYK